ncbi:MAG: hypothetical protein SPL89_05115 [Clostridia bacterium]|nr:hypothetical protein [Clostridia bacterium]
MKNSVAVDMIGDSLMHWLDRCAAEETYTAQLAKNPASTIG